MSGKLKVHEHNPWMQHMLNGDFEAAWKFSDEVLKSRAGKPCWHLPRHLQYFWDGTSLKGKRVLVRCYHGLGDTIQFIRYAPLLKQVAKEVIVWAQAPLIPLLQSVEGIDRLMALHNGTAEVDYDIDIEVMELPHIFRTTTQTIPNKIPYIHVDPVSISQNNSLSVGLVWRVGDWDHRRNIPFDVLQSLFKLQEVDFLILQANAKEAGWKEGFGVHPGEYELKDYARVIAGLDLIISADTMTAHLAGALGRPVWTLLHASADWRWMANRNDSPWYPTMRLFRQRDQDDWTPVIDTVGEELKKLVGTKANGFVIK